MSTTPAEPVPPYASLAPLYDRLVGDSGFGPIWRAFNRSRARYGIRFRSAADIGCGTGRFLGRLSREPGLRLFGVDRSRAMLALARRRLAGTDVRLLQQDMRELALPMRVDLLTLNFSTLNYVTEISSLRLLVARLAPNLRDLGYLVLDIILPTEGRAAAYPIRQHIRLPGVQAVWDLRRAAKHEGTIVTTSTCFRRAGAWRCWRETHVQRWWPAPVLRRVLERAGFIWCGWHRLADHATPSPGDQWVQIVARRRG
jgi:SAM-dependent methyltransferase